MCEFPLMLMEASFTIKEKINLKKRDFNFPGNYYFLTVYIHLNVSGNKNKSEIYKTAPDLCLFFKLIMASTLTEFSGCI